MKPTVFDMESKVPLPAISRSKSQKRSQSTSLHFSSHRGESLDYNSGGLARGSRSLVVAVLGRVTKGPPSSGADLVKATSGISLGRPSNGNSFRNGKNG